MAVRGNQTTAISKRNHERPGPGRHRVEREASARYRGVSWRTCRYVARGRSLLRSYEASTLRNGGAMSWIARTAARSLQATSAKLILWPTSTSRLLCNVHREDGRLVPTSGVPGTNMLAEGVAGVVGSVGQPRDAIRRPVLRCSIPAPGKSLLRVPYDVRGGGAGFAKTACRSGWPIGCWREGER